MAYELLTVSNPSKRRRKMSAKQRAAALRNLRKARSARRGGKRRRRNPVAAVAGNPRRRKRRRAFFARRLRRRRNPSLSLRTLSPRALLSKVTPALIGGGGAVANDLIYATALGFVPATFAPELVENFRSGMLRHVGKAASAVLLSTLAGMVLPRRIADQMGTGALTVIGYNVVREAVEKVRPGTLGMYLEPSLGYAGAGWNPTYGSDWRDKSGLSAYLRSNGNGGNGGEPGGVAVRDQFSTRGQFGTRRGSAFVMPTAQTGT